MSNLCHDLRDIANEHSLELTDHARHSLEEAASLLFSQTSQIAALSAVKDNAYSERNKLVAALAAIYPSGIAPTAIEGWEPEWHGCVYIDLPTGQASWHYHDSEAHLFAHLRPYAGSWDGHSTEEKYQRLAALVALPNVQAKGTEDQKTWCGYVAGLIGTYLGWGEHDAHLEEAVAGIIERRLWALAPRAQAPAPAHATLNEDAIDWPDVESMAHSACEEALAFGVGHEVFHRHMRAVMDKTAQAFRAAIVSPAVGAETTGWVCKQCGIDRCKAACPLGHSAALTGQCPMVGIAQTHVPVHTMGEQP